MQIEEVICGYFKLDGGAMFGVVPKALWNKLNPADEKNLCTWAMRSILITTHNKKILVDTGIGSKQGDKFRTMFAVHGQETLASLAQKMIVPEEITDVFLTHLHFDHVGGAVTLSDDKLIPTFPNATYWSNELHWNWAVKSNPREVASFLEDNFLPLKEQGLLRFIDVHKDDVEWMPNINVRFLYGHTEAMMMLIIDMGKSKIVYPADLIPSRWHVRRPYILAYDLRPLHTLEEKERLLSECISEQAIMVFEHDPTLASGRIHLDERGRFTVDPLEFN